MAAASFTSDRKSTRLNSSHTEIYTLSLHDALPIFVPEVCGAFDVPVGDVKLADPCVAECDRDGSGELHIRSEEHTSELQSHRDLHSFPTRRSSDLCP